MSAPADAELALVVSDSFQHQGLGTHLMRQLIQVARQERIGRLIAYLHADNRGMRRLCEQFDFSIMEDQGTIVARLEIPRAASVGAPDLPG
jgi:acetyltransferase